MTQRSRMATAALVAAVLSFCAQGPARAGDPAPSEPAPSAPLPARATDLEAHLARVAPSIVTLKSLVSWGGDDESMTVSHGAIVDPSGLVLLSGSELGITGTKVRSIHVLLGNDAKEWDAIFVARDSTLDLSYVQILDLAGKTLPAVDLAAGSEPRIGQDLFGVSRTGRGFDYAPSIRRLYVTCRIESPRRMWDFTGEFGESGLPVFDLQGKPVGVLSNQQSAEGGDDDGGSSSDVFLLPLDAVTKSLALARKRVPEALEKNEKAKAEAKQADAAGMDGAGMDGGPPAPDAPDAPKPPAAPGMGDAPSPPSSPEPPPSPQPPSPPEPGPGPVPEPVPAPPRAPDAPR